MAKPGGRKLRIGNLLDYVQWRGDLTFASDPWHSIDSLIAAVVAYANFGENELVFGSGREISIARLAQTDILTRYPQKGANKGIQVQVTQLLEEMAQTERFGHIRILDQVNDEDSRRNIQFSAVTMAVPDTGTVIGYRGTDPSVVGWKEDFMMSYMSPVPAQEAAIAYLKKVAAITTGDLILAGHSKGGNLAIYAAAHTGPDIQARIRAVCTFDGPGLDDETMESESYRRMVPRIRSILPSDSIIGRLLNYHPVYHVVSSTKTSILQHDPFTWNLIGRRFDEVEDVSANARLMDKTLHEWIKSCTPRQRELFVDTVFGFFDRETGQRSDAALDERRLGEAALEMDEGTRQMVLSLLYRLVGTHVENLYDAKIRQPIIQIAARLRQGGASDGEMVIKSVPIQIDNAGKGFQDAVEQTRLMAEFSELNHKDSLRMQLLAEEMLGMAQSLTGEVRSTFWIECLRNSFNLRMTTETVMDRQKRRALIASSTKARNEAARGFLGRLRDAFEQAMAGDADRVAFEADKANGAADGDWDHYEQSVLLRLADDVRIDVRGGMVTLTVSKAFDYL